MLDTNVVVSGLAFPKGAQATILRLATELRFEIIISDHIFNEIVKTLTSPYFSKLVSHDPSSDLQDAIMQAPRIAISVNVEGIATYREDDLVLGTAVSGAADFLVTGDKQLLKLRRFYGTAIVDSRSFLDILDQRERVDRDFPAE